MYTPDDTRKMVVSLREILHYHTKKIPAHKTTSGATQEEPGQLLRIVTNPMEAVIKKNTSGNYEINTLGHTLSRWREIRYIGTRIEAVPLATTGKIDPDDITQSASGIPRGSNNDNPPVFSPQGSIHPYDATNFVSYRRWTGGNISVAKWDGTGLTASEDAYIQQCLKYDQNWLADERFNHIKLTDGFKFDAVPLRVDLETAALAGNSLFGFSTAGSFFPDFGDISQTITPGPTEPVAKKPIGEGLTNVSAAWLDPVMESYFQPRGLIMPQAGNQYHEEGWLPNPLAGFQYYQNAYYTPGNEKYTIAGFYENFPWFADRVNLGSVESSYGTGPDTIYTRLQTFNLNYLVKLVLERFLNPIALVRFPCAYGTMFFWNIFMEHILEVRKPFLVNSEWNAGKVQAISNLETPLSAFTAEKETEEFRTPFEELKAISCISPDPYGLSEEPSTVTLSDLTPTLGYYVRPEPRTFKNPNPEDQEPEDPEPAESIPHN